MSAKATAERKVLELLARIAARPLPEPAPATRVRANACPRCGGYKRTEPRTAYVYCDYCAALFDYDRARARTVTGDADASIFDLLVDGVRAEIRRAFEAKDMVAYRAAWRWPYEKDMELCPIGWSPRVREPAYRAAMVEFSVETCVVNNHDQKRKKIIGRVQQAMAIAQVQPSESARGAYLDAMRALLAYEAKAYPLATHPDALDDATYVRVNLATAVHSWAGPGADELFAASGLDAGTREVEPVDLARTSCGACGGRMLVAPGSRAVVCEACGRVHEPGASAFQCPSCAALVLVTTGAHEVACAWCEARIAVS